MAVLSPPHQLRFFWTTTGDALALLLGHSRRPATYRYVPRLAPRRRVGDMASVGSR